ncbi:MAG: helix-turn-helix domain-containing protein [Pseudomonadota bacterium]
MTNPSATETATRNRVSGSTIPVQKLSFTVSEASAATGIGRTSLYMLIADGKLRAVKAAGRRLILKADLEDFLASCRDAR